MTSNYSNVLSGDDHDYLNNLPEVLAARASLDARPSGNIRFSVPVTETIRAALQSHLGLQLPVGASLPMRYIKGDTAPHVDRGASAFENTYLLYLNDSPGEFIIDSQRYPIQANTGFVFHEGLHHETQNTGDVGRLLLGPMNEFAEPVGGGPGISYYSADPFIGEATFLGQNPSEDDMVHTIDGISSWYISVISTGTFNPTTVYFDGAILDLSANTAYYYLYPAAPCFLEGSTILCQVDGAETYVPVEQLKEGTLVKTSLNGYKPVVAIGKGTIHNPGNDERTAMRLYKCSPSKYPQLTSDLFITGGHSILEYPLTDGQEKDTIKFLGKLFITEKKYRLPAYVDERAEPWNSAGTYTIWHVALAHQNESMNYGIYANGGLLVETCSISYLKKSNMTLVH